MVQVRELGTGAQEVAYEFVVPHYKREYAIIEEVMDVGTERHTVARGIDDFTDESLASFLGMASIYPHLVR